VDEFINEDNKFLNAKSIGAWCFFCADEHYNINIQPRSTKA